MSADFRLDPKLSCDACGVFGAYAFEGEALCGDCYANRGACCSAEFSGAPPKATRCAVDSVKPTISAPTDAAAEGESQGGERRQ